jgi:putative membrane protein
MTPPITPDASAAASLRTGRRRARNWVFALAAAAVIIVPLAVNGLFAGALSDAGTSLKAVPAAVVNNDTLINTTAADGTKGVVFAGRGLVTELTGPKGAGFNWKVTNTAEAEKGLANGTYYAVLTIPSDFSKRVQSQGSTAPTQGLISIKTDDAHGYLSSLVASTVASAVQSGFGNTITAQVVNGVYAGFGTVGTQLKDAAAGASKIADGTTSLQSGLTKLGAGAAASATGASGLASGLSTYASGASTFASGVTSYTGGVSSLSGGLQQLSGQTGSLGQLATGVSRYTKGVTGISGGLSALETYVATGNHTDTEIAEYVKANLPALSGGLAQISAGGPALAAGASGLPALESGIASIASGAGQLDGGSAQLASGAAGLASGATKLATGASSLGTGLTTLASGVDQSAAGAAGLATGTQTLADGLSTGSTAITAAAFADPATASKVVAQPVAVNVSTDNKVTDIGQILTTIILPAGLWLGALAVFLLLRPLSSALLASSVSTGRLSMQVFSRAGVFALAQVVLVVGFLHLGLNVAWSALPLTLSLALVMALAFMAFHQLLATAFGRIGTVISLMLFALQLASTGGLYPVQILSGPFQFLNSIMPLGYAVEGVRAIVVGGSPAPILTAFLVLGGLLVASLALSTVALARRRRPHATGWLAAETAPAAPQSVRAGLNPGAGTVRPA